MIDASLHTEQLRLWLQCGPEGMRTAGVTAGKMRSKSAGYRPHFIHLHNQSDRGRKGEHCTDSIFEIVVHDCG